MTTDQPTWAPPGPGSWLNDRAYKRTTYTVPMQEVIAVAMGPEGFGQWTARYGVPLSHLDVGIVNGYAYQQPVIDFATLPQRAERAEVATVERTWLADAERWHGHHRADRTAANLALQDVDVDSLDDAGLAAHLREAWSNGLAGSRLHFDLIGAIAVTCGRFVAAAEDWGIDHDVALRALAGASPASLDAAHAFALAGAAARVAGVDRPDSLDDIRAASPQAAQALDEAMRTHGWRIIGAADLDGETLAERPDIVLQLATSPDPEVAPAPSLPAWRDQVPEAERDRFDSLLTEARTGYALRDDNAGITMAWSLGLVRRALLAAGRRLAKQGGLAEPDHVFDMTIEETAALLDGSAEPTAAEVSSRAAARRQADRLEPPPLLGEPPMPPPDSSMFPPAMGALTRAVMTHQRLMFEPRRTATGIGDTRVTGRAVVALDATDALARVEPGDVLVTTMTAPGFNAALGVVAGLVTEQGGPMCHAAIMARELGIPTVLGLSGAVTSIPDGATVVVDPVAGTVEVVR